MIEIAVDHYFSFPIYESVCPAMQFLPEFASNDIIVVTENASRVIAKSVGVSKADYSFHSRGRI